MKNPMRFRTLALLLLGTAAAAIAARQTGVFPILRSTILTGKQDAGFYLLPTNQLLRPWGEQVLIKGRPVDMAFDSRKRFLAVLNTRTVELFDAVSGAQLAAIKSRTTSFTGIAFRPGDREIWASETSRNGPDSILIGPISSNGTPDNISRIELSGHPQPCGIAFSGDGSVAYVAMSRMNQVAIVDTEKRQVRQMVDTGNTPFSVIYSAR